MSKVETLSEKYPELYKDVYFEVYDGWCSLLDQLSSEIKEYVEKNNVEWPVVLQVKTKFGGLRFYINAGDNKINEIINKYENMSYSVCEQCGKSDAKQVRRPPSGWIMTLCEKHSEEYLKGNNV